MKTTLERTRSTMIRTIVILQAILLTIPLAASAQSTKVSGTLRHGSGLLDIPVASVLPHGAQAGTYSGFWASNDIDFSTGVDGGVTGTEPFEGGWNADLALALGLFDLLEVGATVHSLEGTEGGGALWGAFGLGVGPEARAEEVGIAEAAVEEQAPYLAGRTGGTAADVQAARVHADGVALDVEGDVSVDLAGGEGHELGNEEVVEGGADVGGPLGRVEL